MYYFLGVKVFDCASDVLQDLLAIDRAAVAASLHQGTVQSLRESLEAESTEINFRSEAAMKVGDFEVGSRLEEPVRRDLVLEVVEELCEAFGRGVSVEILLDARVVDVGIWKLIRPPALCPRPCPRVVPYPRQRVGTPRTTQERARALP